MKEHKHIAHCPLLSLNELIIMKLNGWEMNKHYYFKLVY
jgi:hypothetical protein